MLRMVRKDIEKNYFDPKFGGVDMNAVFANAEKSLKQAQSAGHTFGIIAQALTSLSDSHTFLIPPSRVATVRYGWRMRMVGERCLITGVKPGSDADSKGVKPGDEVLAIEGFRPTRDNLWKMRLMYYSLQPRPSVKLALRAPDGRERLVEAAAEIKTGKQVMDLAGDTGEYDYYEMIRKAQAEAQLDPHRVQTIGEELMIYRMPDFGIDENELDHAIGKARDYKGLILDLRNNPGGGVTLLERTAGRLLGKDVVLAERKGRKHEKPITSRTSGGPITTKLVVLADCDSASAAKSSLAPYKSRNAESLSAIARPEPSGRAISTARRSGMVAWCCLASASPTPI